MKDLRQTTESKLIQYMTPTKWKKYVLYLVLILIILFPVKSAMILATWLNNFIGTFIEVLNI